MDDEVDDEVEKPVDHNMDDEVDNGVEEVADVLHPAENTNRSGSSDDDSQYNMDDKVEYELEEVLGSISQSPEDAYVDEGGNAKDSLWKQSSDALDIGAARAEMRWQ
ncbi:hypothetical protein VTL71DRAFT_9507 [Oculimacula yallundae]|uniref:Uncharacterized protein n=1 Tax=Oculimacula yallundae TaxID=86028 RepID=A0ABR4BS46_9HELO